MDTHLPTIPQQVNENIEAMVELNASVRNGASRHQLAIETATRRIGRPAALYVLFAAIALWVAYNLAAPRLGWPRLDAPPFFWLQGAVALYAAMVATMVLTTQNRQTHEAEKRAHLEMQVNLLAEQKATKIIALLEELRHDLPNVSNRRDPVAESLQEEVNPKAVLSALESTMESGPPDEEAR